MDKKQLITEMRRADLAVCNDGKWYFDIPSALMYSITKPIIASLLNSEIGKVSDHLKPEDHRRHRPYFRITGPNRAWIH